MTYISIRQILDDLLADDLMSNLSLERAVNYAVEFIRILGMPQTFINKVAKISVNNYRAELPCDLVEIISVRGDKGHAYTYATGTFNPTNPYTYKVQGNVIFTSEEHPKLEISYTAFPVDDEGFPLIVDNGTFARALELYIQKKHITILFNNNKLAPDSATAYRILQNIQQEYAFAVGAAQNDLVRPSLDQMESIKRMWTSLIQKNNEHSVSFNNLSNSHLIK